QGLDEALAVSVCEDDRPTRIPASHHMVDRSRIFDSWPAGHLEMKRDMEDCQ
ncbi:MAG: hypothetical protein ACI9NC_004230, partial [Verrucomicrobiales bacterium]